MQKRKKGKKRDENDPWLRRTSCSEVRNKYGFYMKSYNAARNK